MNKPERAQLLEIYHRSFPDSERADFSIVEAQIERGKRLLYIAYVDNEIGGFGIVNPLSCRYACLLEYLAVSEAMRSSGIGGTLLSHMVTAFSATPEAGGIFIEVEPTEGAPLQEISTREKRIRFYEKHGAFRLKQVPFYRIPDFSGAGYLPMELLWLPVSRDKSDLSNQEVRECIVSIFIDGYGVEPNDRQLGAILDNLG